MPTYKAHNVLIQSQHAHAVMQEYRTRLIAAGCRFFDDCFAPPDGMEIEDAMRLSNRIWAEVNEGKD